jgi:hypothetical protein
MEEVDEGNITKLLGSLPDDLNAVERMIMVNEGTVQTFLSVLCRTPVKVEVISQCRLEDTIIRWSKLVIEDRGGIQTVVCLAESIIPASNSPDFISMINDKEKGIGQIIKAIGLKTSRCITGFHTDASTFARTYTIKGHCNVVITEAFNRETIAKVSSTGVKRRSVEKAWVMKGVMDVDNLCDLVGFNPDGHGLLFGGVQPKKDTTGNTKVGEVVASEQPTVVIKEGDSE